MHGVNGFKRPLRYQLDGKGVVLMRPEQDVWIDCDIFTQFVPFGSDCGNILKNFTGRVTQLPVDLCALTGIKPGILDVIVFSEALTDF